MIFGGIDWDAVGKALRAWVVACSALTIDKVVWGQQRAPRPTAPAITMRISNIAENGRPWSTMQSNPLTFADKTVTAVDDVANTLTVPAHALETGDGPLDLNTTGIAPGGTDFTKPYWAVKVDANTLKLAASFLDAMNGQPDAPAPITVDLLSTGTGTITISPMADTVRAGQELLEVVRGTLRVTLELKCHSVDGVGMDMAVAILQRVRTRRGLEAMQAILRDAGLSIIDVDRVRALLGITDAVLFEPRSLLEVHVGVPVEDSAPITYIQLVQLTKTINETLLVATTTVG